MTLGTQCRAGFHLGLSMNEMPFEAKAVIHLVVDALQGAAPLVILTP